MKQTDIFTLILVAGIGTLASFFVCNTLLGDPDEASTKFTRLSQVISADLTDPDPEIFNTTAINPTIEVYVGDCEDIDQNGILDMAELVACGREEVVESEIENAEEGETQDEGMTEGNTEGE